MQSYPIYEIKNFKCANFNEHLYVNKMSNHLINNSFTTKPHSHSFYLFVYFNQGSGKHYIDFKEYPVEKGSFFALRPGQIHNWHLSEDMEGYVIFITTEIYNLYFKDKSIKNYLLFSNPSNTPHIKFTPAESHELELLFALSFKEYSNYQQWKNDKMLNLMDCILIEVSRNYVLQQPHETHVYHTKIDLLEHLIEENFVSTKSPAFYASKMNMTTKHLNRICKSVLNKTATEVITQRVILECKRMLANQELSISQIASELGYFDVSYFSKFFKKNTGFSANEFRKKIK